MLKNGVFYVEIQWLLFQLTFDFFVFFHLSCFLFTVMVMSAIMSEKTGMNKFMHASYR